jgi:pimeloyl-ACP methyl ester carboxylesterase
VILDAEQQPTWLEVQSSDGVVLAVHDLGGSDSGPPLLIAHATGFCGRAYVQLAAELRAHAHVWALDFRAHGDSTAPHADRFDWGGMTDDLSAVIAALTDEPIDLFGHSMGGGVALMAERRKPGTLRTAYLYEPIVPSAAGGDPDHVPDLPGNPMSEAARKRRDTFPSKADALARYASRPPLDALRAGSLAAYVEHGFAELPDGTVRLKCSPAHEAATFAAEGKPTLEDAGAVDVPVTVAVGMTGTGWSPAMFGPAIVEALVHGRLERYPTIGHFGPLEDPITIAAAVLASRHA